MTSSLFDFFFASQRPKQFHSVFCFSGGSVLTIGTFYCATPCPTYCSRWHRYISVYFQWQTFFPSPQVIPHYWHSFKLKHQLHSISQLLLYGFSEFPNYLPWPFSFQSIQYLPPLSAGDCAGYEQRQEFGTVFYSLMDAPKFTGGYYFLVFRKRKGLKLKSYWLSDFCNLLNFFLLRKTRLCSDPVRHCIFASCGICAPKVNTK